DAEQASEMMMRGNLTLLGACRKCAQSAAGERSNAGLQSQDSSAKPPDINPDAPNTSTVRENGRIANRLTQQGLGPPPRLSIWAAPTHRDSRYPNASSYQDRSDSTKGEQLNNQVVHHGPIRLLSNAETNGPEGLVLNPAMSRWLMGFPRHWDETS